MRRSARVSQRLLAVIACVTCAGVVAAASGAETAPPVGGRADRLERTAAALQAQRRTALLRLDALDAQIARAAARVAALAADRGRNERKRASATRRLHAARITMRIAQRRLALRLYALYVHGGTDALAVVLGASSIEDALGELETLNRSADMDKQIAQQAQKARSRLRDLARTLARRDADLRRLEAAAEQTLAALRAARDHRSRLVAELARLEDLNDGELERVQANTRTLAMSTSPPTAIPRGSAAYGSPPRAARTLSVVATGYSSTGSTASGIPAGPGLVAVDPAVIPLGTRITIPGYGEAVAADTGPAVRGAAIDLWFATTEEARAWGRRTVVVTLH